jgi:hypothetical protein
MATTLKFRAAWWWKLKQLGYDVVPIRGKDHPYKGWPTMPNDEVAIGEWSGSGAAVRMKGSELVAIDLDIHVEGVRDKMLQWLTEHYPEFMATCLRRHSQATTLMLIGRMLTAKKTIKTKRYIGEGTDPKGDFVEIFTTNSRGRYIGVAGRHSPGREYDYIGAHITETPKDRLPWLEDRELTPMLAAFEAIMIDSGWEKVVPVIGKKAINTKVYDLLPDQIMTLSDGEKVTLAELEDYARHGIGCGHRGEEPLRGYADLWDPSTGSGPHSSTRVLVTFGHEGLCLFDCKYEVKHRWKDRAPQPDKIAEKLKELMKAHQAKVQS